MTPRDFRELMQNGQQMSLENCYPATVTISGQDYAASTEGTGIGTQLTEGGELFMFDIAFRVRKSLLPQCPAIGALITWNETEYRFIKGANRPQDPAWYLGCVAKDAP